MTTTTRSTPLPHLTLVLCAAAASRALAACGGDECPAPLFGEPVTVTWPPASATVNGVTPVVLRWSTANDPLPERYYEPFSVAASPDGGFVPTSAAHRTGAHELTFDMRGLDSYVRDRPRFSVRLYFPDPMAYTACTHPGPGDTYSVDVAFAFDPAARTATARFGEPHLFAGGCGVAAPGAGASKGGGAVALVALAGALGWRRRRRGAR